MGPFANADAKERRNEDRDWFPCLCGGESSLIDHKTNHEDFLLPRKQRRLPQKLVNQIHSTGVLVLLRSSEVGPLTGGKRKTDMDILPLPQAIVTSFPLKKANDHVDFSLIIEVDTMFRWHIEKERDKKNHTSSTLTKRKGKPKVIFSLPEKCFFSCIVFFSLLFLFDISLLSSSFFYFSLFSRPWKAKELAPGIYNEVYEEPREDSKCVGVFFFFFF